MLRILVDNCTVCQQQRGVHIGSTWQFLNLFGQMYAADMNWVATNGGDAACFPHYGVHILVFSKVEWELKWLRTAKVTLCYSCYLIHRCNIYILFCTVINSYVQNWHRISSYMYLPRLVFCNHQLWDFSVEFSKHRHRLEKIWKHRREQIILCIFIDLNRDDEVGLCDCIWFAEKPA